MANTENKILITCKECGKKFEAKSNRASLCSECKKKKSVARRRQRQQGSPKVVTPEKIISGLTSGQNNLDGLFPEEIWEQRPVDLETFLFDRNYLGNAWLNRREEKTIFPFWEEMGKKIFPLPIRSPYHTVILAGSTGCVDGDTEYYCKGKGWVKISEYKRGDQILIINPSTLQKSFSEVGYVKEKEETLYIVKTEMGIDEPIYSADHVVVYTEDPSGLGGLLYCETLDNLMKNPKPIYLITSSGKAIRTTGRYEAIHSEDGYKYCFRTPTEFWVARKGQTEYLTHNCGKTSFAMGVLCAYYLHIVLCLRNPHEYFDLADQKSIVFAILNIVTKTMAYKNAWGIINKMLLRSPWFMARGASTGGRRPEWYCTTKPVELIFGRNADDIIGLDILFAFMDEVSFARNQSVERQIEIATEVFDAALERMKSRFTKFGGIYEGLMVMASSKRTDMSFLETFTEKLINSFDSNRVLVIDKPRWEVLPPSSYKGKTFPVAVGDKFREPKIISESEIDQAKEEGYSIIYPPVEYRPDFERNIITALTNIAGLSVSQLSTFLSGPKVMKVINKELQNPFTQSVIYVGTKDSHQYWEYFDMGRVREEDLAKPMAIHLDASLGGDGNSISGVVADYATMAAAEGGELVPELHYRQVFKIKVKAPQNDKVMLSKNHQFICWLVKRGFNIVQVSSDQYQCLGSNTGIWVKDKFIPITQVKPGDEIVTFNTELNKYEISRVKNIWNSRFEKKYVKIKTNLVEVEATNDHLFLGVTGYKKAEDLKKYDFILGGKKDGRS